MLLETTLPRCQPRLENPRMHSLERRTSLPHPQPSSTPSPSAQSVAAQPAIPPMPRLCPNRLSSALTPLNRRTGVTTWPRRCNWRDWAGIGTRRACTWSGLLAAWSAAASPITRICGSTLRLCRGCRPRADPCTAPLPGQPEPLPLPSRELLIWNGNALLHQLGWITDRGRAFLKRHFGHTRRQSLGDEQLMQFSQQLEAHRVGGAVMCPRRLDEGHAPSQPWPQHFSTGIVLPALRGICCWRPALGSFGCPGGGPQSAPAAILGLGRSIPHVTWPSSNGGLRGIKAHVEVLTPRRSIAIGTTLLLAAPLKDSVQHTALHCFGLLAEVEAWVHGCPAAA